MVRQIIDYATTVASTGCNDKEYSPQSIVGYSMFRHARYVVGGGAVDLWKELNVWRFDIQDHHTRFSVLRGIDADTQSVFPSNLTLLLT